MSDKRRIVTVGITGGIGSGKSEVCRIFEKLSVPVLYADDIAKDISNYDALTRKSLVDLLSEKAYTSDGVLDRAYVASRVFSIKSIQRKINAIIHPRVEEEIRRRFSALANGSAPVAIVEAALIYEAGLDKVLDAIVVVDADEDKKIARVINRDGSSRESVLERMRAQMGPATKLRKADYIIYNNGTVEELEQRVRFLYSIFLNLEGNHP